MSRKLIATLVFAVLTIPVGALAAAGDPPSRPAPSHPRNPVDRTPDTGAATFKSLDANRDGYVSRDEARNSSELTSRFNELDQDRDGRLSRQEVSGSRSAAVVPPVSSPARTVAVADPPASSRPPKAHPRNPVDRSVTDPGVATFNSFDANRDGYVTREEARESSELSRRFNELDRDGDGKLSLREVTGWHNKSYASTSSVPASSSDVSTGAKRGY